MGILDVHALVVHIWGLERGVPLRIGECWYMRLRVMVVWDREIDKVLRILLRNLWVVRV